MVKATFSYSEDKKTLSLIVKGHAGQDEVGKDIICASASILAYMVAQCVQDMYKQGQLAKKPKVSLKKGNTEITCKPKAKTYSEALHTFFVAQVGYNLLSHNYPQFVDLIMFGEDK